MNRQGARCGSSKPSRPSVGAHRGKLCPPPWSLRDVFLQWPSAWYLTSQLPWLPSQPHPCFLQSLPISLLVTVSSQLWNFLRTSGYRTSGPRAQQVSGLLCGALIGWSITNGIHRWSITTLWSLQINKMLQRPCKSVHLLIGFPAVFLTDLALWIWASYLENSVPQSSGDTRPPHEGSGLKLAFS